MPENRERKSHIKSRLGCSQCKARRVKCDEVRPQCGNCKRRQEPCSYKIANPISTSSPDASGSEPTKNGLRSNAQLHSKQLALMHHYATSTYKTIAMRTRDPAVYQLEVPRLACQHDYLLDAMFALTSCHLAYENPPEAAGYVSDAVRYQARALETYRRKLENLSPEDCQGLFHASALFGVLAMAFRSVDPESATASKPTETMTQLAQLWRGTALVLRASQQILPPETYNTSFQMPIWDMRSGGNDTSYQAQIYLDVLRSRARAGDLVRPGSPGETPGDPINHCRVYLEAINLLQELFQASRLEHSRIVAWIIMVPAQFMELLTQEQPLALAIALLYSVVMEEMEDFWWARPFRHQLVDQLVPVVTICDPELAGIAKWVAGWTKRPNELATPAPDHDTGVDDTAAWSERQKSRQATSSAGSEVEGRLDAAFDMKVDKVIVARDDSTGTSLPSMRLSRSDQEAATQLQHLGLNQTSSTLRAVNAGVLLQLDAAAIEETEYHTPSSSGFERECHISDLKT